eukprot:TRINITY_DN1883_c0_g1_i1.p1 TRINITY_DN1883_c0_g1~~TRINITY_DN1883_c0_g1_i1.p1  ORF type:complete len:155 (-),score=14.97 TRINITY_DN1883_c0_g1_i1:684-1148(-)
MSGTLQPIKTEDTSRSTQAQLLDPPGHTARKLQQYIFDIENEAGGELIKPEAVYTYQSEASDLAHAGHLKLRYRLSEEEYYHIYTDGMDFFADANHSKEKSVLCSSWPYGPLPVYLEYKEPDPTEGMLYFVRAASKPQRKNWPWTNRGSQTVRR